LHGNFFPPSTDVCRNELTVRCQETKTDSEQKDPVLTVQLSLQRQYNWEGDVRWFISHLDTWASYLLQGMEDVLSNVTYSPSHTTTPVPNDKYPFDVILTVHRR